MPNGSRERGALGRRALLGGASASLLGSATGCCSLFPSVCSKPPAGEWHNASSTVHAKPQHLASPKDAAELVSLVQQAERDGKRIRMTGSGHSFSDVAVSDDYLLLPSELDHVLALERSRLTPAASADGTLVRVTAGCTIRFLNQELERRGLAFGNLGGWDAQTIVGAIMTGTHGSGLHHGPIAEQIVSVQVVGPGGKIYQIEPSPGVAITRASGFPGSLEEDPSLAVELVQREDWFNAVRVSMGCMGVVYAVVLRAVPRFWLRETRELVGWRELSAAGGFLDKLMQQPRAPEQPDHVEITVCPYPRPHDPNEFDALLTKRWRLSSPPKPTQESRTRGVLGSGHILTDPFVRHVTEGALARSMDDANLAGLANIHRGLMLAVVDKEYVDASYKVFNFGDANLMRVIGIEMAFELGESVRAMERALVLARQQFHAGRHHTVPLTLRFVKAATPLLAMQHGRDTTMLEIGALVVSRGSQELLENYERAFIDELGARPHWGLDLSILRSFDEVRRLYGSAQADTWLAVREQLNPQGTFDGALTDRLGISKRPRA